MELTRRDAVAPIQFGHLIIRDVGPADLDAVSLAEVEVPIGADNPPFAGADKTKLYVGVAGEVEFDIGGRRLRLRPGDVLELAPGETYSYHNGGYEPARLLLIQVARS